VVIIIFGGADGSWTRVQAMFHKWTSTV